MDIIQHTRQKESFKLIFSTCTYGIIHLISARTYFEREEVTVRSMKLLLDGRTARGEKKKTTIHTFRSSYAFSLA